MNFMAQFDSVKGRFFRDIPDKPLVKSGWRGCVLDRDLFGSVRLPENLWRAVCRACMVERVNVCGFFEGGGRFKELEAEWSNLKNFFAEAGDYSPEFLLFDESASWAIHADVDVTTVALERKLADGVDALLSEGGTSLEKLTMASFSLDAIRTPSGMYVRKILARKLKGN